MNPNSQPLVSTLAAFATLIFSPGWPFAVRRIYDDLFIDNIEITCFGGAHDPQDDGQTASGVSTKDPDCDGVSLPMRVDSVLELLHSPVPLCPWHTQVEIIINGQSYTPRLGVIDIGPGRQATHDSEEEEEAHACDITPFVASQFAPHIPQDKLASEFAMRGCVRIIGGAKYLE